LLFVQTGLPGGVANAAPTEIDGGTVAAATPQRVGGVMALYRRISPLSAVALALVRAGLAFTEKPIHPTRHPA